MNQYEQDGVESLDYQTNKSKFTGEFKLHVIQYRQSNRLTYQEVDNLFGISHASTIANWVHVYKREGLVGLSRPIGRSTKMSTQDKVKKYPLKETEREALERLREENEFLRLSIRYQKKLNALVQEKERKKKERQR
ncbi:MAG: transposase [Erysipelothrix sp.]|nr:transposase [Erysipelothrix sp.]